MKIFTHLSNGMCKRQSPNDVAAVILQLKSGDIIVPLYNMYKRTFRTAFIFGFQLFLLLSMMNHD